MIIQFKWIRRLILFAAFISLLNGCTFHSIKAEAPDKAAVTFTDIVGYLESLHAKLEISPNVSAGITNQDVGPGFAEDVSFEINSKLNPKLSYPNKFRLYVLYETKQNPRSAGDWGNLIMALLTLGTLFPIQGVSSTEVTSTGILLDITRDAGDLAIESNLTAGDLLNYQDPRILDRYKITSQLEGYSSIFFPSAWLVGSSPPYAKTMQIYAHINLREYRAYAKFTDLGQGLLDILKKLSETSINTETK